MGLSDYLHALGLAMQGQQPHQQPGQSPYPQPQRPPQLPTPNGQMAEPQPAQGDQGGGGAAQGGGLASLFKNWTEGPVANGLTALQTPPAQAPMLPGHSSGILQSLLAEPSGGNPMGGDGLQSLLMRLGIAR